MQVRSSFMRFSWLLIFVLVLASCAQVTRTSGSGFVDPAYRGRMFTSMIVDARTNNLAERHAIENSAANALECAGLGTGTAMDIVPPTRERGENFHRRQIMNTGASSVLEIIPGQRRIIRDYIRGSHYASFDPYRDRWEHRFYNQRHFHDDPPLILEEPEVDYQITLYSLPHYDVVWTGDFTTRGPTGMRFDEVGARFGREVVEKMAQSGLIPPPL